MTPRTREDAALRVLYSFLHILGAPGIGTTALNQVRALNELGCNVDVWCTSADVDLPREVKVVETLKLWKMRIPHRALGLSRTYRYHDWLVSRALARSAGQFDIVHVWPRASLRTLSECRRQGLPGLREVPNSHTAHAYAEAQRERELVGLTSPRGHSHTYSRRTLRLEEAEYEAASGLLVPSDYVASTFLSRGFPTSRLLRHQYGYEVGRFRSQARPAGRPLTAIFVGRGEPRKGLHYALRAWGGSEVGHGGRLLVCGDLEPSYRARLHDELASSSVTIVGFTRDIGVMMAQADVLLLPSIEEGSALVVYEAMACGVVPLVSTASGAPITDGVEGFLHAPRDVKKLTNDLDRVSADSSLLHQMRENCLVAAESLTWTDSGRALLRCYRTALGQHASRRDHSSKVEIDGDAR